MIFYFSQIIIEVLLGQGKIIEALRLANSLSGSENLSARKYLEAAKKTNDSIIFYTVYTWFQQRNIRQRGSPDFLKCNFPLHLTIISKFLLVLSIFIDFSMIFSFSFPAEFCEEYINHYQQLYCS